MENKEIGIKVINNKPFTFDKNCEQNICVICQEISTLQNKQEEKVVIDYLYKMYKDMNYTAYIIGRAEFENFVKTMLPIYLKEHK